MGPITSLPQDEHPEARAIDRTHAHRDASASGTLPPSLEAPMSTAPGLPTWFDLMCPDPDASERFYGPVLGWSFRPPAPPEMGSYRMAEVDGKVAAGMGKAMGPDAPPVWSVYFATDDADVTATRVVELGGTILAPVMAIPGAGRMAIFADPTGAAFGVWEAGEHAGAGIRNAPGGMCWCEVNTPDSEAARDFYATLFDLEPARMEGMHYYTLSRDGDAACGVLQMTKEWEGVPPHWMTYFQVESADAAVDRVKAHGGKVAYGPFDTPFGRIAIVNDPDGIAFTVLQAP